MTRSIYLVFVKDLDGGDEPIIGAYTSLRKARKVAKEMAESWTAGICKPAFHDFANNTYWEYRTYDQSGEPIRMTTDDEDAVCPQYDVIIRRMEVQ